MQLTARYNFAIDNREADALAETFTEDGELWAGGELRAGGREDLRAYMRAAAQQPLKIRHWTTNAIIEGEGNEARLRMYVMAWTITDGTISPHVMGDYDDRLVRTTAGWQFKCRNVTLRAGSIPARPDREK
jgi:hypothetical protein